MYLDYPFTNSTKVFKYICIISCNSEKLGQQNQIKVQKLMSNLIGTVKSINSTKAGNLIVQEQIYTKYTQTKNTK
jgi:hypothetical protein